MPQATEKPRLWSQLQGLEHDAHSVGVIAGLLFEKISEHRIGQPLDENDLETACWLINELVDVGRRLEEKVQGALEANKQVAA
jgi:hypothetical protein